MKNNLKLEQAFAKFVEMLNNNNCDYCFISRLYEEDEQLRNEMGKDFKPRMKFKMIGIPTEEEAQEILRQIGLLKLICNNIKPWWVEKDHHYEAYNVLGSFTLSDELTELVEQYSDSTTKTDSFATYVIANQKSNIAKEFIKMRERLWKC